MNINFSLNSLRPWLGEGFSSNEMATGVCVDSRKFKAGNVFIALKGHQVDGFDFAQEMLKSGAVLILSDSEKAKNSSLDNVVYQQDLSLWLGEWLNQISQKPHEKYNMVGVTGTNGKTSICHWLAQSFSALQQSCAILGTAGMGVWPNLTPSVNTTLNSLDLHDQLNEFAEQKIKQCAMEVSSHGLALKRVAGLCFDQVVFTNLSQDHLDFHADMQDYGDTKWQLIDHYQAKQAILNIDDQFIAKKLGESNLNCQVLTYSIANTSADVFAQNIKYLPSGITFELKFDAESVLCEVPVFGDFSVSNLLAVAGVLIANGFSLADISKTFSLLTAVEGRIQKIPNSQVIVDFAHTPEALRTVIKAVNKHNKNKLWVLFGCGGDRDKSKRPLMAQAVEENADHWVVSADNSRSEKVLDIFSDIKPGFKHPEKGVFIEQRSQAIAHILKHKDNDDLVIVAGKGHEDYQLIDGVKQRHSDIDVVSDYLNPMMIEQCTEFLSKELGLKQVGENRQFTKINTDTRSLKAGELFVALKGENFDGHQYIDFALKQGACAVVSEVPLSSGQVGIEVKSCRKFLADVARLNRRQFKGPVVGLTGSCGKTTTKQMLASIFNNSGRCLATQGNLNNDLGVPFTLFELKKHHDSAVIEMGANAVGEISTLTQIVEPNISLLLNANPAHIEGFGSLENVRLAKAEIYTQSKNDTICIVNMDDVAFNLWVDLIGNKNIITFSLDNNDADVYCINMNLKDDSSHIDVSTSMLGRFSITIPTPGKHNVANALAAIAVAMVEKKTVEDIQHGLLAFKNADGRLQKTQSLNGIDIIDDSYNANPASIKASIDVLALQSKTKVLVLGDMAEMGDNLTQEQISLAEYAQGKIDFIFTIGKTSKTTSDHFNRGQHFSDHQSLATYLLMHFDQSTCVLIKGSRSAKMENITTIMKGLTV